MCVFIQIHRKAGMLVILMGIFSILYVRKSMNTVQHEMQSILMEVEDTFLSESEDALASDAISARMQSLDTIIRDQNTGVAITILVMLLVVLGVGILITYDMIHSLNAACKYSNVLSEGNLSRSVKASFLKRKDSVGDLAMALERIKGMGLLETSRMRQ